MGLYRKLPVIIQATQWFADGDHPQVSKSKHLEHPLPDCRHCLSTKSSHGWVQTLEGGLAVCPGDWIIMGIKGEFYPCKPDIFMATYEEVNPGQEHQSGS